MRSLTKWIEIYFSGTYLYFLEKENGGQSEYHWYFAASTILMIVAYNLMFVAGLAITFGFGGAVLASKYTATFLLFVVLVTCWAYFVRGGRYRDIVGRWSGKKQAVKRAAMRYNWLLLAGFFVMAIRLVFTV